MKKTFLAIMAAILILMPAAFLQADETKNLVGNPVASQPAVSTPVRVFTEKPAAGRHYACPGESKAEHERNDAFMEAGGAIEGAWDRNCFAIQQLLKVR